MLNHLREKAPLLLDHPCLADVSYAGRVLVTLSLLSWTRALSDMQDTICRLNLPYAPSRRTRLGHSNSLIVRTYPTRLVERWLDPFTSISLKLSEQLNPTGDQVLAPHTWNPENSITLEDEANEESTTITLSRYQTERESSAQRLRRTQGLTSPSSGSRDSSDGLLRRARRGYTSPLLKSLLDAAKSLPPVDFQAKDDAVYHGNEDRGEGCPLNEQGISTPTPIHICNTPEGLGTEFVMKCIQCHASVLSSLFVEGRTVVFSSDDSRLVDYVREMLDEWCAAGYVQCTVGSPSNKTMPYIPSWATREVLFLVPPASNSYSSAEEDELCGTILQSLSAGHRPITIAVEDDHDNTSPPEKPLYIRSLQKKVIRLLAFHGIAPTALHWMELKYSASQRSSRVESYVTAVASYSAHLYAVQFLHSQRNSLLSAAQLEKLIWTQLSLNTRVVGVNVSVLHALLYYPQAQLLAHKLGNTFRFRAAERSLLQRTSTRYLSSFLRRRFIPAMHTGIPLTLCDHQTKETKDSHSALLLCERAIDYISKPSYLTLLALLSARFLRL